MPRRVDGVDPTQVSAALKASIPNLDTDTFDRELPQLWQRWDKDGDGTISYHELFAADGKQCAALSYDDFYLTHAEQNEVAKTHEHNRLLELRGNGGTHDLQLFDDVLTCVEIKISRCTRHTG